MLWMHFPRPDDRAPVGRTMIGLDFLRPIIYFFQYLMRDDHRGANHGKGRQETVEEQIKIENQFKSVANSFFWIAGLSIINSASYLTGSSWHFIIGLSVTQFIDGVASLLSPSRQIYVFSIQCSSHHVIRPEFRKALAFCRFFYFLCWPNVYCTPSMPRTYFHHGCRIDLEDRISAGTYTNLTYL